jgi:hypothetical protein
MGSEASKNRMLCVACNCVNPQWRCRCGHLEFLHLKTRQKTACKCTGAQGSFATSGGDTCACSEAIYDLCMCGHHKAAHFQKKTVSASETFKKTRSPPGGEGAQPPLMIETDEVCFAREQLAFGSERHVVCFDLWDFALDSCVAVDHDYTAAALVIHA